MNTFKEWFREQLTGLTKAEVEALRNSIKEQVTVRKHEDFENFLITLAPAIKAAINHTRNDTMTFFEGCLSDGKKALQEVTTGGENDNA